MAVMPTGVHLARNFAAKVDIRFFLDRQGIHVGPQRHARSLAATNPGHDTGCGNRIFEINAEFLQLLADQGARLVLLVTQFRRAVKLTPNSNQPWLKLASTVQYLQHIHGGECGMGREYHVGDFRPTSHRCGAYSVGIR